LNPAPQPHLLTHPHLISEISFGPLENTITMVNCLRRCSHLPIYSLKIPIRGPCISISGLEFPFRKARKVKTASVRLGLSRSARSKELKSGSRYANWVESMPVPQN
jgi:hypothetical protein